MSAPAPGAFLPQIERAVQQLQHEELLRQAASQTGQQPPEQESNPVYGELPGEGYLFSGDPEERQKQLVSTSPEFVRVAILRAIETCAMNAQLPYGEQSPKEYAQAALAFSQAYLLLDPSVDTEGVPVGAQETAAAEAAAKFSFPVTKGGYREPPRVKPNPAENAIAEQHKEQSEELRGARGDRPRPQPRVGQ
jgi:hypothetical protein